MSVVQLPPSLNLSEVKPSLAAGVESVMTTYPATNSAYGPGDTCVVQIGTGGQSQFLFGNESYMSFEFTPTFTHTAGAVQLDGCAYALIERFSLYHGATELCSYSGAGRLWTALSDLQSVSTKFSGSIDMGVSAADSINGVRLISGEKHCFCIPLIAPLVGSLSDKATPIGWAQASGSLRMEIQWAPFTQAVTTSVVVDDPEDCGGACSALSLTNYVIENVQYHAKLSRLSNDLNNALLASFQGMPITLAATDYRAEIVHVAASALAVSARLNFNFSSLKAVMWWTAAQSIASGSIVAHNLGRAISGRYVGGELSQYYIQVDGQDSIHIRCNRNGATLPKTTDKAHNFHAAIPYNEVKRIFNGVTSGSQQTSFTKAVYACTTADEAIQRVIAGKFIAGLDCERSDSSSIAFSGLPTKNSNVMLNIEYSARPDSDAHTLFVYGMADVVFSIVNGSFVRSD